MEIWKTQLRKGLLELCVLNVLRHGESYGYEIVQQMKALERLNVTECTVYPILARLKKDGYLSVRAVPSPLGPPRRYFSLTADGQLRVETMNGYWEHLSESISKLQR